MKIVKPYFFLFSLLLFLSCKESPVTERKQLILIPESTEIKLGEDAFQKIIRNSKLSGNTLLVNQVKKVGKRISKATNLTDYKWEFVVIENDNIANAFCLPGGKIGIYTGIIPFTKDEDGLATVIGHEIAHAIARHGSERMTTILIAQLGQIALNLILDIDNPMVRDAINKAYGISTELGVILPFSRKQELEADRIGLILMKKAGYNPYSAIDFWERMKKGKKTKNTPVYLSTHPLDDERIDEIKKFLRSNKL